MGLGYAPGGDVPSIRPSYTAHFGLKRSSVRVIDTGELLSVGADILPKFCQKLAAECRGSIPHPTVPELLVPKEGTDDRYHGFRGPLC